jgi:hypothetical protein
MSRDPSSVVRVALNEEAFTALVSGQVATVRGYTTAGVVTIEIILSDIGFAQMQRAIERAIDARVDRVAGDVIDLANLKWRPR